MDTENVEIELQQILKKINLVEKIRILFLFLSLFMVLLVFYCNKFAMHVSWYTSNRIMIYNVLFLAILIMLISVVVKLYFVAKYNKIRKRNEI